MLPCVLYVFESSTWKCRSQEGTAMVEYSLLLLLIALVCFAAVTLVGGSINGLYEAAEGI